MSYLETVSPILNVTVKEIAIDDEKKFTPETGILTSMVDDYKQFTVIKALTEPDGEIFDLRIPITAKEGDDVSPGVGIRNNGGQSGTFKLEIKDIETLAIVFTGSKIIAGGSTGWIYPGTMPMPGKNWKLLAQIRHNTVWDDYLQKTISLEVAKGSITSYDAPSSTLPGNTVLIPTTAKNTGTGSGSFRLRLTDRDTNVEVDSTSWFSLVAGSSTTRTLSGIMPNRDWILKIILERTLPTGAVAIDDEKKFTAINIVDWWTGFLAWWNGLETWQKALIVASSAGGVVIVGKTLLQER